MIFNYSVRPLILGVSVLTSFINVFCSVKSPPKQFLGKIAFCEGQRATERYIIGKDGDKLMTTWNKRLPMVRIDLDVTEPHAPFTTKEEMVKINIQLFPSVFTAYVRLTEFWTEKSKCVKLYERRQSVNESKNWRTGMCFRLNVDFLNLMKTCLTVKFILNQDSINLMRTFYPVTEPPKWSGKVYPERLYLGDKIECSYPKEIKPQPAFYIVYEDQKDPRVFIVALSNKIIFHIVKASISGTFYISCVAVNTIFSSTFAYKTKGKFVIQGFPYKLSITPWEQIIFTKNEKIECKVFGDNNGCEWYQLSGKTSLKTESKNDKCILYIKSRGRSQSLFGGMYEWVCASMGKDNHGYLFQRKIFYVFVPLSKSPHCVDCSTKGSYANKGKNMEYRCILDDEENFPGAVVSWRMIEGDKKLYSIDSNVLRLMEQENEIQFDIVLECTATDIDFKYHRFLHNYSRQFWATSRSKKYKFKSARLRCSTHYISLLNVINACAVILLFLLVDIYVYRFLHVKRIQECREQND